MGPREIGWRTGRAFARQKERFAYHRGWYSWTAEAWQKHLCPHSESRLSRQDLAVWWQNHMRSRQEPDFLLNARTLADAAELYKQLFSDQRESLIQIADRVCRGEFSFLGIDFRTTEPISWQRDPETRRDWPAKYHADVQAPFCDGTGSRDAAGDVKHVWELNRHEFLIDCAKAYFITGETRYPHRVFQIVTDWTAANPYLQGVNWSGPLEVALRSIAWLWSYQFCRGWRGLSAEDHLKVIQSFYQHGAYLHRHIEIYTSPNNHLVGEAAALYLLGSFFPEFDESASWRDQAWGILVAEPDRQFYEDGGSTEQATSYHHYCLGFYLLAVLTRQLQQRPVPQAMLDRLEAACQFSMWMTTPDGTVPRIGDTDDARSIRFTTPIPWDFRNLLSLGAILFQRPDFKAVAGSFSEDALWLLGAQGYDSYESLSGEVPKATTCVFPKSGYAILRSGWGPTDHHACFDSGPIGLGLSTSDVLIFTHGHADLLSVTICAFGQPLLVDTGFYTYNGSPAWNRYTRDVQGHNTVRVDGQSQARFNRANAWSCVTKPGPLLHHTDHETEQTEGSHSGFDGVPGCLRHRRSLVWNRNSNWLILDRLEGTGDHEVEAFFHFAPGQARVLPNGRGVQVLTSSGIHAVLQVIGADCLQTDLQQGGAEPDGGWLATSYGRKEPAPVVRFHGRVEFPFSMIFSLFPSQELSDVPVIEQTSMHNSCDEQASEAIYLNIRSHDGEEIFGFYWDDQGLNSIREKHLPSSPPLPSKEALCPLSAENTCQQVFYFSTRATPCRAADTQR